MSSTYFNITPNAGMGITPVTASTNGTNLTYSARTATVTISGGGDTKTVTLRQNGLPHCVSERQGFPIVSVASGGGEVVFSIITDFYVCFSGANQSNYTLINNTTHTSIPFGTNYYGDCTFKPNAQTTFTLQVPANSTETARTDTITMYHFVEGPGGIGTYEIAQYNFPIQITTEPYVQNWQFQWDDDTMDIGSGNTSASYGFSYSGIVSDTIYAQKNGEYDWLTITANTANTTVTMTVTENPVAVPRSATVYLNGRDINGTWRTIYATLTQSAGTTSLIVSPTALTYGCYTYSGSTYSPNFNITSNTEWTITQNGSSYSQHFIFTPSAGTGNAEIDVRPKDMNGTGADYTNTLTVSGGNATATVQLTQTPTPHFSPLQRSKIWALTGETQTVQIVGTTSNMYMMKLSGETENWEWIHIYDPDGNELHNGSIFDADDFAGRNFTIVIDPVPSGTDYRETTGYGIRLYHFITDASETTIGSLFDTISGIQDF